MAFRVSRMAVIAAVLVFAFSSLALAAPRRVLFEQGTEWACGPCAAAAPTIHAIRDAFGTQLVSIKWHAWWPGGNDPWYWHNNVPQQTRIQYYGINGIPDVMIDGAGAGNSTPPDPFSFAQMSNAINARLAIASPIGILNPTGLIQGSSMNISFDVNVETPQAGANFRLFVVVTEEDIPNNNPNGETHNWDVYRRSNANSGEVIDLSVAGMQHFDRSLPYHASYNILGLHGVVFVQNSVSKEVLQASEFNIAVPYHFNYAYNGPSVAIGGASQPVNFASTVTNDGANNDLYNVSVTGVPAGWAFSYTTPAGTFSGPSTLQLNAGQTAPISLTLDSQGLAGPATVQINLQSQGDPLQTISLTFQKINGMGVLLVDDDGPDSRENAYTTSLNAAGVTWARWSITSWGSLTGQNLVDAAGIVVWFCGTANPSLTPDDRAALDIFLANGGDLFINGSDVAYSLADPGSPNYSVEGAAWLQNVLHATYTTNFVVSTTINGTAGDPIGDGLTGVTLSSTPYVIGLMDGIQPAGGAQIVFSFQNQTHKAGIRHDNGTNKVVYFSFPWECLPLQSQRDLVMDRILDWMGATAGVPPTESAPVQTTLAQNSPNPFNPSTTIEYRLGQGGPVALRVYDLNGRMVRELVNEAQDADRHAVEWDGRDDMGRAMASGVYFYQLNAPGVRETRRMVLTK
jgi:hypothetical protein